MVMRSFLAAILMVAAVFPSSADGISSLELYQWNKFLSDENWRVLLASNSVDSMGVFLADAATSDLDSIATTANAAESLATCGISLVDIRRTMFTSPFVPPELTISDPRSRALAPSLDPFFARNPSVKTIVLKIEKSVWVRMLTSETTSLLYASAVWSDPTARAALIKCVTDKAALIVVESKLEASLIASFKDAEGQEIEIREIFFDVNQDGILNAPAATGPTALQIQNVRLARRRAICADQSIYFRNAVGDVGQDRCQH